MHKIQAIKDKLMLHWCAEHFDLNEHCIGGSLEILSLVERDTLYRRNPSVDKRLIEKTSGIEYDWRMEVEEITSGRLIEEGDVSHHQCPAYFP